MKKILKYCFNTNLWNPTKNEWCQLLASLPKDDREKITRFMFKRDSKQSLVGQVLIRYCLMNLLNIEWNNLCIARTQNGKPFLKLKETLTLAKLTSFDNKVDFNVSHAGDYTIIAAGVVSSSSKKVEKLDEFDQSFKIGTDVMKIDVDHAKASNSSENGESIYQIELRKHERVINGKFSNTEKNFIYNKINPVEKLSAFYRLWCLKESYVKALGDGIGFDVKRVELIPQSELLIDLNLKRHLVANDTQIFVDSKLVKTCKFYEQYYSNRLSNNESEGPTILHIMTLCVVEKDKNNGTKETKEASSSSLNNIQTSSFSENDEFIEITLKEILESNMCTETINETNTKEYDEYWNKFCQKVESPFKI